MCCLLVHRIRECTPSYLPIGLSNLDPDPVPSPDPDPVPSLIKGGESSQWWRCRRQMHGSGKEAQAAPELQAGWLAVLMPDPL